MAESRLRLAGNKLLEALPGIDQERLSGHLSLVTLPAAKVVHEPGTARHSVYFPVSCVFSKQFVTSDGDAAEVASIGNEGLVGIPLLFGSTRTPIRTVVQVAGSAWRGDGATLHREFTRSGALQNLVLHFAQALITQMGQNAVCYQHHRVEQQFCLWLLLNLDRVSSNHLHLTHEVIGLTLGIRRTGISEVINHLQREGIIQHGHGCIEVLDRARLENACCECYDVIKREYARLLPQP
jgi:CRP-like cAMP-binding protein